MKYPDFEKAYFNDVKRYFIKWHVFHLINVMFNYNTLMVNLVSDETALGGPCFPVNNLIIRSHNYFICCACYILEIC